jgi:hypothetical protein
MKSEFYIFSLFAYSQFSHFVVGWYLIFAFSLIIKKKHLNRRFGLSLFHRNYKQTFNAEIVWARNTDGNSGLMFTLIRLEKTRDNSIPNLPRKSDNIGRFVFLRIRFCFQVKKFRISANNEEESVTKSSFLSLFSQIREWN